MVLANLSFRGYSLRYNPIKLEIKNTVKKHGYTVPMVGTSIESVDHKPVVYTGVGEFCGEDCIERYRELERIFLEGRMGVLCIPDMPSVTAWFTGLEFLGDTKENILTYKFEFTQAKTSVGVSDRKIHICKSGETLYDIAYDYGVSIEKLVKLNPYIKRPDELKAGEQVRLC